MNRLTYENMTKDIKRKTTRLQQEAETIYYMIDGKTVCWLTPTRMESSIAPVRDISVDPDTYWTTVTPDELTAEIDRRKQHTADYQAAINDAKIRFHDMQQENLMDEKRNSTPAGLLGNNPGRIVTAADIFYHYTNKSLPAPLVKTHPDSSYSYLIVGCSRKHTHKLLALTFKDGDAMPRGLGEVSMDNVYIASKEWGDDVRVRPLTPMINASNDSAVLSLALYLHKFNERSSEFENQYIGTVSLETKKNGTSRHLNTRDFEVTVWDIWNVGDNLIKTGMDIAYHTENGEQAVRIAKLISAVSESLYTREQRMNG